MTLDENAVREIEALGKKKRKTSRLVTPKTVGAVLGLFRGNLVDMQDVFSGLGCAVGSYWRSTGLLR
jgi:hypothetical protein